MGDMATLITAIGSLAVAVGALLVSVGFSTWSSRSARQSTTWTLGIGGIIRRATCPRIGLSLSERCDGLSPFGNAWLVPVQRRNHYRGATTIGMMPH